MKKIESFVIVSRYNEEFSWIEDYTDNYIIYNKGVPIEDNPKVINDIPNRGKNALDIPYFAHTNYGSLPELMAFIQVDPFPHCRKEDFDRLIYNTSFTVLDSPDIFGVSSSYTIEDGVFAERNNGQADYLMYRYFEDYVPPQWVKFGIGCQYIVEKNQLLAYPPKFWKSLDDELRGVEVMEAHWVERCLWYILTQTFKLKKEFCND